LRTRCWRRSCRVWVGGLSRGRCLRQPPRGFDGRCLRQPPRGFDGGCLRQPPRGFDGGCLRLSRPLLAAFTAAACGRRLVAFTAAACGSRLCRHQHQRSPPQRRPRKSRGDRSNLAATAQISRRPLKSRGDRSNLAATAQLSPAEELLHRVHRDGAPDSCDRLGEGNLLRADLHAVLRVAAVVHAALRHEYVETF
jgi:hypothetical protein